MRAFAAAFLVVGLLAAPAGGQDRDLELVGAFLAGPDITGAVLSGENLYVTTLGTLSIYDVSDPLNPRRQSIAPAQLLVHGELLATNDRVLLLNDYSGTLDVWDVEDKTNPVPAGRVLGVGDEHFSCVLDCLWVYGSNGTIVDLRDPEAPVKTDLNWKALTGTKGRVHRLDESRPGILVTAPRGSSPTVIDARDPLAPVVIARTRFSAVNQAMFLYSEWPQQTRHRYLFASIEATGSSCENGDNGALLSFDTAGWPDRARFRPADRYRVPGGSGETCQAYYPSFHPDFRDNGLIALPASVEGVRVVEVGRDGSLHEVDAFKPPVSEVWLAFWADSEILYLLNATGEVYILSYS